MTHWATVVVAAASNGAFGFFVGPLSFWVAASTGSLAVGVAVVLVLPLVPAWTIFGRRAEWLNGGIVAVVGMAAAGAMLAWGLSSYST